MRILVTGGAGLVGSHLCDQLVKQNHNVICVDNFFTGQKRNIDHMLDNSKFTLLEHDIIDPLYLSDHLNPDVKVDQIYNLACPASPIHYQHNPIRTVKANTTGMINMLGMAKQTGARILQTSTSEVYGDPQVHPQPESYVGHVNPLGPRACYDEGKRVAETLCINYHRQNKVDVRIVRIFNTYGPHMHENDGRVISNFIMQALNNQPITIHGDGHQSRSFCYVEDLVSGLVSMMNQTENIGPINLGNPEEVTMHNLAQLIISLTNSSSKLIFTKARLDDPARRQPDITLAKKTLDWQPTTNLTSGLTKTISYFRSL